MIGADRIILLVEDNYLVGETVRHMLEESGWRVIGPVPTVAEGRSLIEREPPDAGLLDINLRDGTSFPLAQMLDSIARPYVFLTGYMDPENVPDELRAVPRLSKPLSREVLDEALRRVLRDR